MRKILFGLVVIAFSLSEGKICAVPVVPGISGIFDIGAGYRKDNLDWSISAPSGTPNILNEVKWKNLQIVELITSGHLTAWDHVYVKGSADWGWVLCGDAENSYFLGDDRTLEVSHFDALANNGDVFDLSAGIGANLFPWNCGIELAPLVGYSLHGQNFKMGNALETIAPDPIFLGGIRGLHVRYHAIWQGPWLGGDFSVKPTCNTRIDASYEYHWACFHAKGRWKIHDRLNPTNLFINRFKQSAHGRGQVGSIAATYTFAYGWGFRLIASLEQWQTSYGRQYSLDNSINNLPLANQLVGTLPILDATRLNPVTWRSLSVCFEFDAEF